MKKVIILLAVLMFVFTTVWAQEKTSTETQPQKKIKKEEKTKDKNQAKTKAETKSETKTTPKAQPKKQTDKKAKETAKEKAKAKTETPQTKTESKTEPKTTPKATPKKTTAQTPPPPKATPKKQTKKQVTKKKAAPTKAKPKTKPKTKTTPQGNDISLGRIYFPRAFVHEGKAYKRAVYRLILTEKNGVPWFKVLDKRKNLLFEEMAVIKQYENPKRRHPRLRIKKEMLKGYEYFRITVSRPDKKVLAYFLVKTKDMELKGTKKKSEKGPELEEYPGKKSTRP